MYPPGTTTAIKTQTFPTKVFYPTREFDSRKSLRKFPASTAQPVNSAAAAAAPEHPNKPFRVHNNSQNVWRTRSNGSTGSSPGASTSPSLSTNLSRDSSVGSGSTEELAAGHIIARQGVIIARGNLSPMKPVQNTASKVKGNSTGLPARSSKNSASKAFNHKEVVDRMSQAFADAKRAIDAGRGKYYDPKDSGAAAVAFTPFNWENFWQQRKMNEL